MPSCDKETEEVFFDSVDYIGAFDSVSVSSDLASRESEFEIWSNEPGSVRERRERFLGSMGFNEFSLTRCCSQEIAEDASCSSSGLPEIAGLERITDYSGAVSRASCGDGVQEGVVCDGRETDAGTEPVDREVEQGRSVVPTSAHDLDSVTPKRVAFSVEEYVRHQDKSKNKIRSLWKSFTMKRKGGESMAKSDDSGSSLGTPKINRLHVQSNRKKFMEFTGLYIGQEIQAHKGFIWTMKFSPDGRYLATGGEDGVVRIWRVTSADATCKYVAAEGSSKFIDKVKGGKLIMGRKNSNPASVVIPKKVFKIEESLVQEFHGHVSDVLDLSWSKSNFLLSSSKDKTVRLWKVGSDECLNVFHHKDYVNCIQFNPVDDGYFISGSIDGKVRLWGVSEGRVVDWADARDIITAICYQPDGQGFIVGSITGGCRFYNASGNHLQLDAKICVQGKKKCSGNRITGIQFSVDDYQRVMITSADSKVRILNGVEIIHKYRGLRKSGSQTSASFTSNGRHIISVGEDSHVYVWNYDIPSVPSSKQPKSVRSCEHFFAHGVSVAIPWSSGEMEHVGLACCSPRCSLQESTSRVRDSDRFSLGSWFSMDSLSRGSATWPEEKLPLWDIPVVDHDHQQQQQQQQQRQHHNLSNHTALSATWGQVIVTAGWDGVIRTFHNYGLPVRR